ncbi:glutathione S-transferase T3-like [Phragmites australis]|uniref:glutathione S-transferase T3-like n=1 Tax=Phragmites australis TaxID=29695 RepID=UPI002D79A0F2|nr:glutathione S-transferase T3-like [Phragmites australis]
MEYADFLHGDDDGIIGTQPPLEEVQSQESPGEIAAGGGGGCGQSYTMKGDLLLVSSWLNMSMDPVVGNNQSLGAFWQRIETYFHDNKDFPSTRNKKSLQGRWTFINGMVQKFCTHYARALHSRRSGMIEGESIVEACKMFQAVEHKEFTLLPCWRELRHHPKWQSESSRKKQKTSIAGSPASTQHVESSPEQKLGMPLLSLPFHVLNGYLTALARRRLMAVLPRQSQLSAPMKEIFDRQFSLKERIEKDRVERFAEMMNVERQRLRFEEERMQMEKVNQKMLIVNMDHSQMDED